MPTGVLSETRSRVKIYLDVSPEPMILYSVSAVSLAENVPPAVDLQGNVRTGVSF